MFRAMLRSREEKNKMSDEGQTMLYEVPQLEIWVHKIFVWFEGIFNTLNMTKAPPLWVEILLNIFDMLNQHCFLVLRCDLINFKPVLEVKVISEIRGKKL